MTREKSEQQPGSRKRQAARRRLDAASGRAAGKPGPSGKQQSGRRTPSPRLPARGKLRAASPPQSAQTARGLHAADTRLSDTRCSRRTSTRPRTAPPVRVWRSIRCSAATPRSCALLETACSLRRAEWLRPLLRSPLRPRSLPPSLSATDTVYAAAASGTSTDTVGAQVYTVYLVLLTR